MLNTSYCKQLILTLLLLPTISFSQTSVSEDSNQEPVKMFKFYLTAGPDVLLLEKDFGVGLEAGIGYRLNKRTSLNLEFMNSTFDSKDLDLNYSVNQVSLNLDYFPFKEKDPQIGAVMGLSCLFFDKELELKHDSAFGIDLGIKLQSVDAKRFNGGFYLINTYTTSELSGMLKFGLFAKFTP